MVRRMRSIDGRFMAKRKSEVKERLGSRFESRFKYRPAKGRDELELYWKLVRFLGGDDVGVFFWHRVFKQNGMAPPFARVPHSYFGVGVADPAWLKPLSVEDVSKALGLVRNIAR